MKWYECECGEKHMNWWGAVAPPGCTLSRQDHLEMFFFRLCKELNLGEK